MTFLSQIDEFHAAAAAATGLSDFGADDYLEPMRHYLQCLDENVGLNQAGRGSFAQGVVGILVGRLMMTDGLKNHPDALNTLIKKPIFIVGMGRTGTTALHRLLDLDPESQSLPFWLGNAPMPRPPEETWASNPVFQKIKAGLEQSPFFNPEMQAIHPVYADLPDECRWGIEQSFWSSTLLFALGTPSYERWHHSFDSAGPYAYYHKLLQLIADGDARRWILKDPGHIFGIQGLLELFPDACIIQTHREPVEALRSFCDLGWHIRKEIFEDQGRPEDFGDHLLNVCSWGLRNIESIRREAGGDQFLDLHMLEIKRDVIGTLERIYDHFNLHLSNNARQNWERQIKTDPSVGHGKRARELSYGLSRDRVNTELGIYYERYRRVCDEANIPVSQ
jgi:Sulfotransferase family